MAENSKIEWTHHTFNPWVGCTKVSAACDHCYAESWAKRSGSPELWQGERRRTTASNWRQPLKWNADAYLKGERQRVFCASLADVFDNQVPAEWRKDLFALIDVTPNLDWLLLTKRPQNIVKMLWHAIGEAELWPWPNVWLGTTAEDMEHFRDRWRHLREIPAQVHFISYEPALGPLHLFRENNPDWIICGGESGSRARMMDPAWARTLRDECAGEGVAFFMKQMTHRAPIPGDLMVRQFPAPVSRLARGTVDSSSDVGTNPPPAAGDR
jgi:protein gp37